MTTIAIDGEDWLIDGVPTCAGRDHRGFGPGAAPH
jgi:hypothetical protein